MSAPSRTRSLRKPSEISNRLSRSYTTDSSDSHGTSRPESGTQSPSRLPVKPSSRSSVSTVRPPSATSRESSARPPPSRISTSKPPGGGLQRSSSKRDSNASSRPDVDPVKKDRSRPPIVTRHRRDASTNVPSNVPPPSNSRPSGHTRNKSSSISISSNTSSTVSRPPNRNSMLERPKSIHVDSQLQRPSRNSMIEERASSTRTNRNSMIEERALSTRTNRNSMIEERGSIPTRMNRNSMIEERTIASIHPSLDSVPHPQLRRPAFSTLQQHFSPARNLAPKPHPAAFLAPPSPSKLPSNIAISAETSKLQNELLQLHLLHKDSFSVSKQWRASAKRKLGLRFQSVVNANEDLVLVEVEEVGKINAGELKKWRDQGTPGWGLEERIQVVDEVLNGVWNLGAEGGKYGRVIRKFERWLSRCRRIMDDRAQFEDGLSEDEDEIVFLEELDSGWKDDCLLLSRKLEVWRNQLNDLGEPDRESSLGRVVEGCRFLVKGMLTELGLMGKIERDALKREADWIRGMNDELVEDERGTPVAGAVWRSR